MRNVERTKPKEGQSSDNRTPKAGCFHCKGARYLNKVRRRLQMIVIVWLPKTAKRWQTHVELDANFMTPWWTSNNSFSFECVGRSVSVASCADSGADTSGMSKVVYEKFVMVRSGVQATRPTDRAWSWGRSLDNTLHRTQYTLGLSKSASYPNSVSLKPTTKNSFVAGVSRLRLIDWKHLQHGITGSYQNRVLPPVSERAKDDYDERWHPIACYGVHHRLQ